MQIDGDNNTDTVRMESKEPAPKAGSPPVKCPHCGAHQKKHQPCPACHLPRPLACVEFECGSLDEDGDDVFRANECYERELAGLKHALREALIPLAAFKISDAQQPFSEMCHDLRIGLLVAHDYIYGALRAENDQPEPIPAQNTP